MSYQESLSPSRSWLWSTCKKRYAYRYSLRIKPLPKDQLFEGWLRLFRGQVIHAGMEAGFTKHSPEAIIDEAIKEEQAKSLSDEQRDAIPTIRFESLQIVQDCLDWLPASDWTPYVHNGVSMVEAEVRAPLAGFPGGFMGYVDLVAQHKDGGIYVIDYKTKQSFGADGDEEFVTQLPYYIKALRYMGVNVSNFALVEIKSTLPKRASRKVRVDSEDIKGVRESVDGRFRWVPKLCTDRYLDQLWKNLEVQARSMAAFTPEYGYVSRSPFSCKSCEYRQICDAELAGDDLKHILSNHYQAPPQSLRVIMEE